MRCAPGLLCALIATGCALGAKIRTRSEGPAVTRTVEEVPVRGFETKLVFLGPVPTVSGELLAVDAAHVWILSEEEVVGVHRERLQETLVTLEKTAGLGAGIWTAIGTASAASHGWFFPLSAALWLAFGIPSAAGMSAANTASFKGAGNATLWQFARFPQGLPPGWSTCEQHGEVRAPDQPAATSAALTPIVRLDEAPGCRGRGAQILSGNDMNANGFLEPEELLKTTTVCSGEQPCTALEGSLTVHTTLEWELLAQSGCGTISGDLTIEAPGLLRLSPEASALMTVTGTFRVRNNFALTELSLPALRTAGHLDISGNAALASVSLPALEKLGGALTIARNPRLRQCLVEGIAKRLGRSAPAEGNDGTPNTCP